jgi:hypothetical protein
LLAAIVVLVLLADLVMRVPWVDSIAPLGTLWIIGREIQAGWLVGDRYAED